MNQLLRTLFQICLLSVPFASFSQQFGGNPPSIKWRQINTDTSRVIFPNGLERYARDVAAITGQLSISQSTIGNSFRKINIVLQNQTTFSNGYVGLGPYRSEFYLNPLQNSFDLGSIPWHQQLALHEFRHVQQFNNFRKGISSVFYIFGGELAVSLANSAAVPNWFWEGDAVFQETKFSKQGRGRLPHFFNGYRSIWSAGKNYSWQKLRNGSLRDYVPDHYQLGYLITAYGRQQYGDDIWAKVTDDAVRFKGLFYPFQKAIRKYTGTDYDEFRSTALNFFKDQTDTEGDILSNLASQQKHFLGDEEYPQWLNDTEILLVNSSYKRIPTFVKRNVETGKEIKIRVKDISTDNYFSYRNNRIVYAGYSADARWGWRDYSDIRVLDVSTGEQRTITHRSKYFAPDISEDGSRIVAVEALPSGQFSLHLINAADGAILSRLPNRDSVFYTYPKFYRNNQIVTAVRNQVGEMALVLVDASTGSMEQLVPFSMNVIGFPNVSGDTITFTATSNNTDALFAIINKKLHKFQPSIENKATGSYQLSLFNGKLAWTNFTAVGYRYLLQAFNPNSFEEIPDNKLDRSLSTFGITSLNQPVNIIEQSNADSYEVRKYKSSFRLFNFHSWLPNFSDAEYGYSFLSENILNTLQTEAYFTYNRNEESKKIGFLASYAALYPWIRIGGAFTKDRPGLVRNNTLIYIDEWEGRAGLLLPLNFSRGRAYRSLQLSTDIVFAQPQIIGTYKDSLTARGYSYLNSRVLFSSQSQKARQHIYPRFAQTIELVHHHSVTSLRGEQFLANGYLYLPGVHVNHNLVVNVAWQNKDTANDLSYSNRFPFSRGYSATRFPSNFLQRQQYKAGANYHLPLLYPDWGIGNIVYFLRVRANAFYDFTRAEGFSKTTGRSATLDYRSYGAEIYFDTKWWNQQPISFGVRYSRLLDGPNQGLAPNQYEFILPVDLINR
ncbi:MAG: hypothetical protein H7Y31_12420 [Chitinophagaceae bacterium]|nr:hypothetical protein [Chitinophagaceae bacterium]